MLLWGSPGTGKSLSAKLAAKKLGYALISASWGNILGSSNPDRALNKMLDTADNFGGCVLFFDDFDKGFSGWESNADGGVARRLSQKLLTWMQEHESPVLMLAAVDYFWIVDSFGDICFLQKLVTPELFKRWKNGARHSV